MWNRLKGNIGEQEACSYLKKKGYKILEKNYRCLYGEIDIIAKHNNFIVFVEVKKRNSSLYGRGSDAVTNSKQRKIILTAENYINEQSIKTPARFDVISIDSGEITHIENAFSL